MIYTTETVHKLKTASDVKYALSEDSYFFSRSTMRFFGDKITSFGVRTVNGKRYLYRKPSARVNVFGTWKIAGREFFIAWEIVPKHDHVELVKCDDETKDLIYSTI